MKVKSGWLQWTRQPVLVLWFLYVAAIPIYVGESGLPQPSNLLLVVMLALIVPRWDGRLDRASARTLKALGLFTLWVCVVDFGWAVMTGRFGLDSTVMYPFYYLFNALVLFLALLLYRACGEKFLQATLHAILFAIVYQFLASFVYESKEYRGALFFNNPNQLGYWALLAACLVSVLNRPLRVGTLISGAAITGCGYLAVLSASRAALGGIGILLVLLIFSNPKLIIAGALATLLLANVGGPLARAIDHSEQRAEQDQKDKGEFVEVRGYNRLWEYKEYVLLGAGEGDLERFTTERKAAHEIHSSAATVLFSYGIVGAVLFTFFLVRVLARSPFRQSMLLVPTLAYTVAHQGLRFSVLWLLIAVFVALKTPRAFSSSAHAATQPAAA